MTLSVAATRLPPRAAGPQGPARARRITLPEAGAALERVGYSVEITTVFEPDDYLTATEADGDTLSVMGPISGQAAVPQLTTCD